MAVVGDREQPHPDAGVQPPVAVGERRERVHEVVVLAEVSTVVEIRLGHLTALGGRVAERRVQWDCDLGFVESVGEHAFVAVGLLFEVRSHVPANPSDRGKGFGT